MELALIIYRGDNDYHARFIFLFVLLYITNEPTLRFCDAVPGNGWISVEKGIHRSGGTTVIAPGTQRIMAPGTGALRFPVKNAESFF